MKRFIIIVAAVVLIVGSAVLVTSLTQKNDIPPAERITAKGQDKDSPSELINLSFSNLDSFSAQTLDGGTFTSENFKDYDLTVVNIWGTFCGPCREEMPELASFANALPSRIQFITICTDADGNTHSAKSILSDAGFKGTTVISGDAQLIKLLNKVQYVPTTLFFDSKGMCVGTEIIGSPYDFSGEYTRSINSILSSLGKENI